VTLQGNGKTLMERLLALAGIEPFSLILVQCLQVTETEFKYLHSRLFTDLELNTRSYRHKKPLTNSPLPPKRNTKLKMKT